MAYEMLLREGKINGMTLPHRIITGPMERGLANRDGTMNQRYIDYLTERARGGAALIQVESTYVDPIGMGHWYQVGCHGDHVIEGLKRLTESVHAHGAKCALEIYLGGRETPSYMSMLQPIAPSVVKCEVLEAIPTPREMTQKDINHAIDLFSDAARRIVEAGMDMVHLHGAHGYLLSQFLSPYSNRRSDKYGGSRENRARFGLEILKEVRRTVGDDFPIGYRLTAEEYIDDGLMIEDAVDFCQRLADNGVDLIDVSGGIYESFHLIIQGAEAPKGGFVQNAATIKKAVGEKVPVSVAQKLSDPAFANEVMEREGIDFISLTRAFHADPHYARKIRENRAQDVLPCIACHHCTNLLELNEVVACAANPHSTYERRRTIHPVKKGRKIMVVGGGPAGMHAARILARQGHQVSLFERSGELGGQMGYSSRVAEDYGYLVTYLTHMMDKLKVDVRLNTTVERKTVEAFAADAVVIATGARGGINFWPVVGNPNVLDLFSALDRPDDDWEDKVVITTGESHECFLALYIAGRGAEVYIAEAKHAFSEDKMSPGKELLLMSLQNLPTVHLLAETTVEKIGEGHVIFQKHGEHRREEGIGSVVIGGRVSNNELYDELQAANPALEIYNVGDSVMPREVINASHEAAEAAEMIGVRTS